MTDTDLFRALDDSTRRLVLDLLVARDGRSLFDICAALVSEHGITSTRQAISQHLAVLEQAGLITAQRRGRTKIHYVDTRPLGEIARRWPTSGKEQS